MHNRRILIRVARTCVKALHELGAIGVTGSFAVCLILLASAAKRTGIQYAVVCESIATIAQNLLVPSLAVVLISGMLAMILNSAYLEAGWVWLKALLGIGMFEGTLQTVVGTSRRAAELSALAVSGQADQAQLSEVLRTESGGLWLLLVLSLVNVVLAVWRPRYDLTLREK